MKKSKDFNHNQDHIFRIIEDFDLMLRENLEIKNKFNLEVVLLAICWHDVWKSQYSFNLNPVVFLLMWFYEGWGSFFLFTKAAKKAGLSKEIIKPVQYSIRKHSTIQVFANKTIESRILKDLDNLEEWSLARLAALVKYYLSEKKVKTLLFKLLWLYYDFAMLPLQKNHYYFAWANNEFKKRRLSFMEEMKNLKAKK